MEEMTASSLSVMNPFCLGTRCGGSLYPQRKTHGVLLWSPHTSERAVNQDAVSALAEQSDTPPGCTVVRVKLFISLSHMDEMTNKGYWSRGTL